MYIVYMCTDNVTSCTHDNVTVHRNGRWRSEWEAVFSPGGSVEMKGVVRAQVRPCYIHVLYHTIIC